MEHKIIQINWFGPYRDLEEVKESGRGNGLYLLAGLRKFERGEASIQYCGITKNAYSQRFVNHHALSQISRDLLIWLGQIAVPENYSRAEIELAEKIIVFFWQPELNTRLRDWAPDPTTVISHWYTADGKIRINQKAIYRDLEDVMSWDGEYWRSGNLAVYAQEFEEA